MQDSQSNIALQHQIHFLHENILDLKVDLHRFLNALSPPKYCVHFARTSTRGCTISSAYHPMLLPHSGPLCNDAKPLPVWYLRISRASQLNFFYSNFLNFISISFPLQHNLSQIFLPLKQSRLVFSRQPNDVCISDPFLILPTSSIFCSSFHYI